MDKQSSSEGSCHILKVPAVEQQPWLYSQHDFTVGAARPSVNISGKTQMREQNSE